MLKYIFIALITAAVWGVVIWLELPLWIAIAVSGVAFAIVATILIIKWVRARRASKEIERALKAQAEAQARSARPDLEADIRALQGEFNKAINALKGSRLGARGASSALYSLPWYVIVGPPGVGKSTALRNSGLKFPFLSSRGGVSVQGVGGTRNCEWWMTSEAVILDTAGRYTTEGADREEWFAFLGLLRKYRQRRPINGVLAAVSIADIAEAHPEEVASLAREVRARIDELQERLGVVVPVYLIFTKCDLLPGFVEMFSDLTEGDRHQIWGFTLAANNQIDIAGQCTEHFDELTAVLEKRALRRLAEERSGPRRDRIHEFPQYVAGLRESLARFVHEMTEGNIYNETPILRGLYMSSGTQEGRPVNRIMSAISEAFGLRPTMAATAAPPVDVKSYFLGDIFRKIIFPDFRLTRLNRTRTKRSRIIGNVAGIVSVLLAIGIVWLPLVSFRENRTLLTDASTAVAYLEEHVDEDTVDAIALDRIEPLRLVVELLEEYDDDGEPWAMRMGMYQGARVYPRLRDVYAGTVRRELLLPTIEQELAQMRRFVMRYGMNNKAPESEQYAEHFNRLRLYLLVTGPKDPGEPSLDDETEREFAKAMLTMLWERPVRVGGDAAPISSIERVAETYLEMLAARPELAFEREKTEVERVREILSRSDRTKAVANALIESVGGPSLTLKKMVAVSTIRNDDRIIRPAFTRKGYERYVKPYFVDGMEALLDPGWVLAPGDEASTDLEEGEVAAIKTEYFRQYIQEWRVFVDSIYLHIGKSKDSIDALGLLTDLTRTEPYRDLFSNIAWHTQLVDLEAEEAAAAGGTAPGIVDKALKNSAEMIARRQAGSLVSRSGLSRVGVNATVPLALFKQQAAEQAERLVADPNQANIVTEYHVTYAFLALSEFGARPKTVQPEDGSPPPPPEAQPIDEYQEQLKFVRDALQERMDDPTEKEGLEDKLKGARKKVKSLLSAEKATRWSSTLEKLLWPPLEITFGAVEKGTAKDKQKKWCNEVVTGFERTIAKGYPFNKNGQDVALADFIAFFEPEKGELWAYYDKALKSAIPLRGNRFERADLGATSGKYRGNVVSFLNAANEVTHTMFPRGAEGAEVEFDVLIQGAPGIKEISLTVDGEKIKYRNGPEVWGTLTWPGEGAPGAVVDVKGFGKHAELESEGEWGLYRLLELGKVKPVSGTRMFIAQWDFRDEGAGLIQMKFRPKRADTPFFGFGSRRAFMSIFRTKHLAVPRAVMMGAPKCGSGGAE